MHKLSDIGGIATLFNGELSTIIANNDKKQLKKS